MRGTRFLISGRMLFSLASGHERLNSGYWMAIRPKTNVLLGHVISHDHDPPILTIMTHPVLMIMTQV